MLDIVPMLCGLAASFIFIAVGPVWLAISGLTFITGSVFWMLYQIMKPYVR